MESLVLASFTQLKTTSYLYLVCRRTAVSLSYRALGDISANPKLPPIFIFHGLLESKKHWDGLGKTMFALTKRMVVSVDLRNHGDSPHASSHKYEDMVEDILQMFDKLAVKRASVIGNNMGGRACMSLALTAPKRVAGLLVVDISPVSSAPHFTEFYKEILLTMKNFHFNNKHKKKKARKEAKKLFKPFVDNDHILQAVLDNVGRTAGGRLGWTCNLEVLIKDFDFISSFPLILRKSFYRGPTLFLGGQFSNYIPPEDLNPIRECFPKAVIQYITKTGINPHVGDSTSFLVKTISFIRKHRL